MEQVHWESPDTPVKASDYVFVDGKRFVRPYFFEFIAHAKQRWSGKTIVDLFAGEFRQRPHEYYVKAVDSGRILVNDRKCSRDYRVKTTQKLSHFVHRHEPPVLAGSVVILENEAEVITVNKPASVPVHACGQYRKNTVIGILKAEHDIGPLYPIHRLDRPVSGLLIFAKTSSRADKFRQDIETGIVRKVYVAKVEGVFPEHEVVVNALVLYDPREGRSTWEDPNEPASEGKEACTKFRRLSTDGIHSLVQCEPLTGRTHQIRVHLQYTGHPIANDALYLHPNPPKRSKVGGTAESAARSGIKQSGIEESPGKSGIHCTIEGTNRTGDTAAPDEQASFLKDDFCTHCPSLGPSGYDDNPESLWLHCVRYSSKEEWSYQCPLPDWAV